MSDFWLWFFAAVGVVSLPIWVILAIVSMGSSEPSPPPPDPEAQRVNQVYKKLETMNRRADHRAYCCEWESAVSIITEAIEICDKEAFLEVSKALNSKAGLWALSDGKFKEAIAFLSRGTEPKTDFSNRAIAHYSLGNYAECLEDCMAGNGGF